MVNFFKTILSEMVVGNFSFAILIVGIAQFVVMLRKKNTKSALQKRKRLHAESSRWEISYDGYYTYCLKCGYRPGRDNLTDFCPKCGRRMDGGKNA